MKSALLALALATASLSAADPAIIPLPKEMHVVEGGRVMIFPDVAVHYGPGVENEAKLFSSELEALSGSPHQLYKTEPKVDSKSGVLLQLDPSLPLGPGGYTIKCTVEGLEVTGKDTDGVWYGTRSILQLMPPKGDAAWKGEGILPVPAISITDEPRFAWRGMMLDVGRHYFPIEDIKGFIDWLAFHKFNRFHWHLTEDQGWRIEIKKYPKLTEVGAWRDSSPPYGNRLSDDHQRYGGFYTQEQIKDLVAYAAARHITIMPEIDMPGHMSAAIAAYPELGNNDIPDYQPKVATRWGVHPYILAPTEQTFQFIDDVLTEVCALFPSQYIDIGGDEAPKVQWDQSPRVKALMEKEHLKDGHEVQSYFIKRVEKILASKGRKLVGWDEIREGGLSPEATVMSWRGEEGGIASAKEGHDVVMASNSHLYFDHYQAPGVLEIGKNVNLEAIGGFQPIYHVYEYDPVPHSLMPDEAKHVLGVQAQLWTEYMLDWKKVEYMAFPRIAALSEISWTPVERKDYDGFLERLKVISTHYEAAGIKPGPIYQRPERQAKDGVTVTTTMKSHQDNWPELMYDGRMDTFFWAERGPKAGDLVTLTFPKPPVAKRVKIITGGAWTNEWDILESGVIETSPDGKSWTSIATFSKGIAEGDLPAGTQQIRVRVTAPQDPWVMFREMILE